MNPSPPDPAKIAKFEIREQEGVSPEAAANATAWLNLEQLLEKIVQLLNGQTLDTIIAAVTVAGQTGIAEKALAENERWKQIFAAARDHHVGLIEQLECQKKSAAQLLAVAKLMQAATSIDALHKLASASERLAAVLDRLESHHRSGLLQVLHDL